MPQIYKNTNVFLQILRKSIIFQKKTKNKKTHQSYRIDFKISKRIQNRCWILFPISCFFDFFIWHSTFRIKSFVLNFPFFYPIMLITYGSKIFLVLFFKTENYFKNLRRWYTIVHKFFFLLMQYCPWFLQVNARFTSFLYVSSRMCGIILSVSTYPTKSKYIY